MSLHMIRAEIFLLTGLYYQRYVKGMSLLYRSELVKFNMILLTIFASVLCIIQSFMVNIMKSVLTFPAVPYIILYP